MTDLGFFFLQGNATTNDLWSALSKASGQDVHAFMVGADRPIHSDTVKGSY